MARRNRIEASPLALHAPPAQVYRDLAHPRPDELGRLRRSMTALGLLVWATVAVGLALPWIAPPPVPKVDVPPAAVYLIGADHSAPVDPSRLLGEPPLLPESLRGSEVPR
jgi:hypothetical protein